MTTFTIADLELIAEALKGHTRRLDDAGGECRHDSARAQMFYAKAHQARTLAAKAEVAAVIAKRETAGAKA